MGTGGSFLRSADEDDVTGTDDGNSQEVIKRIPIEVKPRGKIGLRTGWSIGKTKGSGSMRSALSVDLDSIEVEKVRKEFDIYRLSKENEITSMQKKVLKLETENRRLRAELQTVQKTCRRLREERDGAVETERQALFRSAALESDRDKIQRQFKLFRETKEGELRNLLKSRRELEGRLTRTVMGSLDEAETVSRLDSSIGVGHNDWWTLMESEPSLGSTTQLHCPPAKMPDFASSSRDSEIPFVKVSKEDWKLAQANLALGGNNVASVPLRRDVRLLIVAANDRHNEATVLVKECKLTVCKQATSESRFLVVSGFLDFSNRLAEVDSTLLNDFEIVVLFVSPEFMRCSNSVLKSLLQDLMQKCVIMLTSESSAIDGIAELSGARKTTVKETNRLESDTSALLAEIRKAVFRELNVEERSNVESQFELSDIAGVEVLTMPGLWDPQAVLEHKGAMEYALRSTCELGFEKYYEQINIHISAAGPLPPLLISGSPGWGKSLLLAKWTELHLQKSSPGVVLYHFVSSHSSQSTEIVTMLQRFALQLMHHINLPLLVSLNPMRLSEEFPRLLEKASSRIPGGLVIAIDSGDLLLNKDVYFKWLLDPLPVDCRVIISVNQATFPQSWRSWPTLNMEQFTNKNVRELLRAEFARNGKSLESGVESQLLMHCRSSLVCNPLYVVSLSSVLIRFLGSKGLLDYLLDTNDNTQLFEAIFKYTTNQLGIPNAVLLEVLRLLLACSSGLHVSELMDLVPQLTWHMWQGLWTSLTDCHCLCQRAGLVVFAHDQVRSAAMQLTGCSADSIRTTQQQLRRYFEQFISDEDVPERAAVELLSLLCQLEDKSSLKNMLLHPRLFLKLYVRGNSCELLDYWHFVLGSNKIGIAGEFMAAWRDIEKSVGHGSSCWSMSQVADVYECTGRFLHDCGLMTEALSAMQKALEIRQTSLDPDHPSVAQVLHEMAGVHAHWGRLVTAETLYREALEIYESAYGTNHSCVAREMESLALVYHKLGKRDLAAPLKKHASAVRRQVALAKVKLCTGDTMQKTLTPAELASSPVSADQASTLNEMGVICYLQGDTETAELYFQRSLQMREAVCGPDHTDVAQSLNNLAALYYDAQNYDKAEPFYSRAVEIRRKHFPSDHPAVISVVKHLALLYKKQKCLEKALPLYEELVDIQRRTLGASHPSVAAAMVNLGILYCQRSNHSAALPLYNDALKIYELSYGPSHQTVAETLKNLALLQYEMGNSDEAAQLYRKSMEIRDLTANQKSRDLISCSEDTTSTLLQQDSKLHATIDD